MNLSHMQIQYMLRSMPIEEYYKLPLQKEPDGVLEMCRTT